MGLLAAIDLLGAAVAPPRCAVCGRACARAEVVCEPCDRRLASAGGGSAPLAGIGWVDWAARYEGAARELVGALKFGGRLRLADLAARTIAATVPPSLAGFELVPVPAAPARRRARGYDPAELIARCLARRLELSLRPVLERSNGQRQVGRRRADRVGSPPAVRAVAPVPVCALLVDDVLTTGATLRACAAALAESGCSELRAAVFARALGGRAGPA